MLLPVAFAEGAGRRLAILEYDLQGSCQVVVDMQFEDLAQAPSGW